MPVRSDMRNGPAVATSRRSSTRSFNAPISAVGARAAKQMHVEQQRAAAHDLHELAGLAALAGTPAAPSELGTEAPALGERRGAALTAVHQAHDRRTRDEPAGGRGGGLDRRDHDAGRPRLAAKRARER